MWMVSFGLSSCNFARTCTGVESSRTGAVSANATWSTLKGKGYGRRYAERRAVFPALSVSDCRLAVYVHDLNDSSLAETVLKAASPSEGAAADGCDDAKHESHQYPRNPRKGLESSLQMEVEV